MTVTEVGLEARNAPLYTVREASRFLDVHESTFRDWSTGYRRSSSGRPVVVGRPVLTRVPTRPGSPAPSIPFVGLAEGAVLAAFRRSGVPLQRIRPALEQLDAVMGIEHALASKGLYTDGAEVIFDFATRLGDDAATESEDLVVVRNGQRVFNDVVRSYLRRLQYDESGYVSLLHLPVYEPADVVVDPLRGFGQPIFARGGARVEDVLGLFHAGESLQVVSQEYGVQLSDLEAVLRVATRSAA